MQFTKFAAAAAAVAISAGAHAASVTADIGVQNAYAFTLSSSNVSGGKLLTAGESDAKAPVGTVGSFVAGEPGNSATVSLGDGFSSISFEWGTPDSYNTLLVGLSDGTSESFTAAALGLSTDTYIDFVAAAGLDITSLTFVSNGQPAFEAANFAVAVPEPTNVALLLAGLGLVGTLARRRRV